MSEARIGERLARSEDARFLRGQGRYVDDLALPRQAHGAVVRSPHAFARIARIDAEDARAMPGVLAVLTAEEAEADGLGTLRCDAPITGADGRPCIEPPRRVLAREAARHVGDPVAFVVAETAEAAQDAAEAVEVDYDVREAVVSARAAREAGAATVWDEAPGNLSFRWETGDRDATERAFAEASRTVSVRVHNNRLVAASIEPRGAVGEYDPGQGSYTLHTPTQGGHTIRRLLAEVLGVTEHAVRVVTPDVGGAFGMKLYFYPEQVLVAWAARRVGRPVKWASSRAEAFLSDTQGRDQTSKGELALDAEGRILGLRVHTLANLGAYLSTLGPLIPTAGGTRALTGPYEVGAAHVTVEGVFTNTTPVDAYRGAGRPEAIYLIERLMAAAARETGLGRVGLRRRTLVPPVRMPYTTALGQVFDSGDFPAALERALDRAEWADFPARREEARARDRLRGIGLCTYMEPCGGNRDQFAEIRFDRSGGATVMIGSQSTGQGHETAYAQLVADQLGLAPEKVRVIQGDTAVVGYGRGTSGSRSLPVGGAALHIAGERVIAKARRIAAHLLEAREADIEHARGRFAVKGTDRALGFAEIVAAAYEPARLPEGLDAGLDEIAHYMARPVTYPNGCHVCEIEIDRDTAQPRVVRYTIVDDYGRIVNPMLVEGQVHGGVAQGIGQALMEDCVYDADGQPLTGSFMDYQMPRAADLSAFDLALNEVPCLTNPLGVKGCGEAGSIAAPPAVIDAVLDALSDFGVTDIQMPATPRRIWEAMHRA